MQSRPSNRHARSAHASLAPLPGERQNAEMHLMVHTPCQVNKLHLWFALGFNVKVFSTNMITWFGVSYNPHAVPGASLLATATADRLWFCGKNLSRVGFLLARTPSGTMTNSFSNPSACWQKLQSLSVLTKTSRRCTKRRKFNEMLRSHTVEKLLELVGRGRVDISCATDVARAVLRDGLEHETVEKLAALGNFGNSQPNAERDLHTWLNMFGLRIEPYTVHINVKVWFTRKYILRFAGWSKHIYLQKFQYTYVMFKYFQKSVSCSLCLKVNGLREVCMPIGVLLPHEVIHALATCDANHCFQEIFMGNLPAAQVAEFWRHVRGLSPWSSHPHLTSDGFSDFHKLIGVQFHVDGAEFYRDDECCCYSWSSIFATAGMVSDVMLYRFPMVLIHERHMQQPNAAWL